MNAPKHCDLCGREYIGDDEKLCGPDCKQAEQMFTENLAKTFSKPSGGDPRIFFYDASFGFLVDRWTVLTLQRLKTRDIELQKELDFHMHRLRRCLETKIVNRQLTSVERDMVSKVAHRLLVLNAKGWQLRSLARNGRIERIHRASAAYDLVELLDERAKEIRQLDLLVTGRTHAWKIY